MLVPVRFEGASLPIDVRAIHTTDLDGWGDDPASPPFQALLRALGAMIARQGAGSDASAQVPAHVVPPPRPSHRPHRHLRAAVRQHERRSGAGVLQRRHHRGHHHRPEQGLGAVRASRATRAFTFKGKQVDVPQVARQLKVSHVLEGSVRKAGRPRAHHRAADRRVEQRPRLGRALRPRPERHLRAAGRDLAGHRQGAQAQAAARGKEGDRAARHDEPRGLQPLPDGAPALRDGQRMRRAPRRGHHPPVSPCHRDRPELRARLGADGRRPDADAIRDRRTGRRRPGGGRTRARARRQPGRGPRRQGPDPFRERPSRRGVCRNRRSHWRSTPSHTR